MPERKREQQQQRKEIIFLCRSTVGVKIGGKVIPVSFLKIEGKEKLVGTKNLRERDREELVGSQNPGLVAPPRSKKGQERREQRKCQGRSSVEG